MSTAKLKVEKGLLIWASLFSISLGVVLWFGAQFVSQFYTYHRLTHSSQAEVYAWGVEEIKEGKYALYAKYTFTADDKALTGKTIFDKNLYPNSLAAQEAIKEWKELDWNVSYDHFTPSHSTLQKAFPIKPLLHTLIGLGICFYFLYLRRFLLAFRV